VGTGSGRTTHPLLERGVRLVGVDLSRVKLCRLADRVQGSPPPLAQADAIHLPFPAASFDAVITIHLLHLVANWEMALREFRRMLRPGGVYLRRGERPDSNSLPARMRHRWQVLLEENRLPQRHGARSDRPVEAALQEMGAVCAPVEVTQQEYTTTPGREVKKIAARTRAGAWSVPEQLAPRLLANLEAWAAAEFGSLEREFCHQEELILDVWRF